MRGMQGVYRGGERRGAVMCYIIPCVLFCAGFTAVVGFEKRTAGFRNESESEEAASRFVRAVYTARLIEIAEVRLLYGQKRPGRGISLICILIPMKRL